MTLHSAKGLEWRIVALPHLVRDVFPGRKKSSCWLKSVTELPASLRDRGPRVSRERVTLSFTGGHYGFERGTPDGHGEQLPDHRPDRSALCAGPAGSRYRSSQRQGR